MSDNEMLYCLVAFILGWVLSRHMGNGFSVGGGLGDDMMAAMEKAGNETVAAVEKAGNETDRKLNLRRPAQNFWQLIDRSGQYDKNKPRPK